MPLEGLKMPQEDPPDAGTPSHGHGLKRKAQGHLVRRFFARGLVFWAVRRRGRTSAWFGWAARSLRHLTLVDIWRKGSAGVGEWQTGSWAWDYLHRPRFQAQNFQS